MPATTKKQAAFMNLCLHSPGKARKKCPSNEVAREFSHFKGASKHNGWLRAHRPRHGIK